MDWLDALTQLRREGSPAVLVTVVAVRGHAPREAGAKMVVGSEHSWGSVGGGNLEESAIRRARELIADGAADVGVHHLVLGEQILERLPRGAHVLIMSHDHAEDFALCDAALRLPALGSIGLIGSSAKWSGFRRRLAEAGHPASAIERITCPIGLPGISGKEPAVIAVSVAAALLSCFPRSPEGGPAARPAGATPSGART